jgi:hypothetical protein
VTIYEEKELTPEATYKKILLVRKKAAILIDAGR